MTDDHEATKAIDDSNSTTIRPNEAGVIARIAGDNQPADVQGLMWRRVGTELSATAGEGGFTETADHLSKLEHSG